MFESYLCFMLQTYLRNVISIIQFCSVRLKKLYAIDSCSILVLYYDFNDDIGYRINLLCDMSLIGAVQT